MQTEKSKEIVVLEKKVNKLAESIIDIVVTNDEEMLKAGEIRKEIKQYAKEAKISKEEATKPLNGVLKTIREWFAPIENKCDAAIAHIEIQMNKYQRIVNENRRKAEVEAQRKIDEANAKLEAGKITEKQAERIVEKVEAKIEKVPEVITKSDSFHTRVNRKVNFSSLNTLKKDEIMFLALNGYIFWNEVKARKDALAGIVVPGTEIYEEKTFI